jgi:hypothetical protein
MALAGAVIYAQNQAEKGKKPKRVFETSKSGTPTPIEEAPPAPGVTPPAQQTPEQSNESEQSGKKNGKKKKNGEMTIMPSSKSMTPPPPKERPVPPT